MEARKGFLIFRYMEPREKALALYNYYEQLGKDFTRGVSMIEFAKLCATKAVDEIITEREVIKRRVFALFFSLHYNLVCRNKEILGLKWKDIGINPMDTEEGKRKNRVFTIDAKNSTSVSTGSA